MKNCATFVALAKGVLGERTTDAMLGDYIGKSQQTISLAKSGTMSDDVAMSIGELLAKHGLVEHPGEVILFAHAERKTDPKIRRVLLDYVKGVDWRRRLAPPKRRQLLQQP